MWLSNFEFFVKSLVYSAGIHFPVDWTEVQAGLGWIGPEQLPEQDGGCYNLEGLCHRLVNYAEYNPIGMYSVRQLLA